MAENVTREEIAEMIEFVRGELSNREFGGHESEYVASARRSLAIAEKLPALVAERERFKAECEAHETQSATIVQNYFDIGRELGPDRSPFEAVMWLKADRDRLADEVERLKKERREEELLEDERLGNALARAQSAEASLSAASATIAELREALESLLPAARAWEFAETRTYCYGDGRTEPFEWGLNIQFQQTRDAMPADQFATAVEGFHAEADEEEADLPSRRARAVLAQLDAAPVERGRAFDPATSPSHTDLMIPPEAIDEALAADPLPEDSFMEEKLGRFCHHPSPAIDFCVEVGALEAMEYERTHGFDPHNDFERRLSKALDFNVGGDEIAVRAKGTLREIAARFHKSANPLPEEKSPQVPPVAVDYTNWRGERRVRAIAPSRIFFGSNEWHKEPQWLLEAIDPEDGKTKTFSFAGIHGFGEDSRLAQAERAIAEAVEIMRPMAKEAGMWGAAVPSEHKPVYVEMGHTDARYYGSASVFSIGDLRAASAFVEKHGGAE